MPVKSEDMFFCLDNYLEDMVSSVDVGSIHATDIMPPLLSEDIWSKFDLEDLSDLDLDFLPASDPLSLESIIKVEPDLLDNDPCIGNHDCMWAGLCVSEEHPADEHKMCSKHHHHQQQQLDAAGGGGIGAPGHLKTTGGAPALKPPPHGTTTASSNNSRSLLLKPPLVKNNAPNNTILPTPLPPPPPLPPQPLVASPDSPPISDDEDTKIQTTTLKLLTEIIEECDIEEDSDLCDYFDEGEELVDEPPMEDPEMEDPLETKYGITSPEESSPSSSPSPSPPPPVTPTTQMSITDHGQSRAISKFHFSTANDHCYFKDKNASMRMANLGIETPSDSEEEIDVVSVGEKQNINSRMGYALPTNPSSHDRRTLQRTVASAIRISSSGGIKTLPPVRKYATAGPNRSYNTTRRLESRGVKRSKYGRSSHNPYKRRHIVANSSDSEQEPSEKRSLHNNMERQRRIDLRNAFEDLRLLVPEVSSRERAAKVVILREAAVYCDQLGDISDDMVKKVHDMRKYQERLRTRLSQLRKNLAAKR